MRQYEFTGTVNVTRSIRRRIGDTSDESLVFTTEEKEKAASTKSKAGRFGSETYFRDLDLKLRYYRRKGNN